MDVKSLLVLFLLLDAHVQNSDAALRIVSNRMQLFKYDSVSLHCDGLSDPTQLRGIRNTEQFICDDKKMPVQSCKIQRAYPEDSGEYWCETKPGDRSNSIKITITAGSVILVSPVLPVAEGSCVTLICRNKTSSEPQAEFYKDGVFVGNISTGQLTIHSVSKSDEGRYKCSISGAGESAESWLRVTEIRSPSGDSVTHVLLILRTVFTILMVALLLLLLGLFHWWKPKVTSTQTHRDNRRHEESTEVQV